MRVIKHYRDEPICVNGMETDDKEVFIVDACDGREQFFYDGKVKTQLKSFGYGSGLIYIKIINDEKVFYSIIGDKNQEGSVGWTIDSFLPDSTKADDLYTDFVITEEYKQQKPAEE